MSGTTEAKQLPKLERVKTLRERNLEAEAALAIEALKGCESVLKREGQPASAREINFVMERLQQALNESGE